MRQRYSITLRFKTRQERDYVAGQITDGWGENALETRIAKTTRGEDEQVYNANLAPEEAKEMRRQAALEKKWSRAAASEGN